jgi:hypothetical protein
MIKSVRSIFLSLLLIPTLYAQESEVTNPLGCKNVGYRYRLKTIELLPGEQGPKQTMYFFRNESNQPIALHQMRQEDSARSLFINHTIAPQQWAVLAANENVIKFICSIPTSKSEFGQVVDCQDHVRICQNTQVRFGLNNKGNFWIVRNSSKNEALRQVVNYGIIP